MKIKKFRAAAIAYVRQEQHCIKEQEIMRERGAAMLGWTLDELIGKTILAMRSCEDIYEKF